MITQPVSIRQPEIGALIAGTMTALIRPMGRLAALKPGDLLWVREPFLVAKRFECFKPTTAAAMIGGEPVFSADHDPAWFAANRETLSRIRHARELPKVWHRQHLRIDAINRMQLHDVAAADLQRAGWTDRAAFAARWDASVAFPGTELSRPTLWAANPLVLHIAFTRIAAPIPAAANKPARPNRRAEARTARAAAGVDRSPCPNCGTRRDRGCEHFPVPAASEAPS